MYRKIQSAIIALILALSSFQAGAQTPGASTLRVELNLPAAIRDANETRRHAEYDRFLQETGFPDLPAEIAKTLASPEAKNLEQINRDTLEANWKRMQLVNSAREVAAELLAKLAPRIGDPASAETIAILGARLLSQKRLAVPDAFPDAIRNMKNWDQREKAKNDFLSSQVDKNILRMREQTMSDSLHAIYGRRAIEDILAGSDRAERQKLITEIRRLDVLINRYITGLYYDHEMGLGQWLGEAFALGLVHTSRTSKDPSAKAFEALLDAKSRAHGAYLSDAVSDTLTFANPEGKEERVQVKNGDTITEMYGSSMMSRLSASGPRPHISDRLKASMEDLITPLYIAALGANEDQVMWKTIDGKELSLLDNIQLKLANSPRAKQGASHAGMAIVYRNAQSGVAVTRALDQYAFGPTPWGSTRFVTTKSIFATPGVFVSFGVASLRPKDTLTYLQERIRREGFKPAFMITPVFRPGPDGKLAKTDETYQWKPEISESEQREIMNVKLEDAEAWYKKFAERATQSMLANITKYGTAFRTYGVDQPTAHACYCTEMVDVTWKRVSGGHSMRSDKEQSHWLGRLAKKIPVIGKKMPQEDPISPSAMSWDEKTETEVYQYFLMSPVATWFAQHQPHRTDLDPALTSVLSKYIDRNVIKRNENQIGMAMYPMREYIHRVEVTVVPEGKKPNQATFVPRANPMGVATNDSPWLAYQQSNPKKVDVVPLSAADAAARRAQFKSVLSEAKIANASDLATKIMTEFSPRLSDVESLGLIEVFTAKMMALKPVNPPRELPQELKNTPADKRESVVRKYVAEWTAQQIETQTRQILSDLSGILYGSEAVQRASTHPNAKGSAEMREKLAEYYEAIGALVTEIHVDQNAGDSRSLGTSLATLLIGEAIKTNNPARIASLAEKLKAFGLQMSDFFNADVTGKDFMADLSKRKISDLNPKGDAGRIVRERLSQPNGKRKPTVTELAQLLYSPYIEVEPALTRGLDKVFSPSPKFARMSFSPAQQSLLIKRVVSDYMLPLNREQMGAVNNPFVELPGASLPGASPSGLKIAPICQDLFKH